MFKPVDTRVPSEVEAETHSLYSRMYPAGDRAFVPRAFGWAEECFTGRRAGYQAVDARYHDFEHTLQGTLCMVRLLFNRHQAGAEPVLSAHVFELGLLAILFHDTGYLKKEGDQQGTGAKYTVTHVARSAQFAREFLSEHGYTDEDLKAIESMIRCTGVNADIKKIHFQNTQQQIAGFALATADLLGQMAARDYVDKLPVLYQEFAEAIRFSGDLSGRLTFYRSPEELVSKTPDFFEHYVLPRVRNDFHSLYLFLHDPYPDGPNIYLDRIQKNLDQISARSDKGA